MKTSDQDKIEGSINQIKGKSKEKTGEVLNDPAIQARGTDEKVGGKIQSKLGDIKKVFGK